MTLYSLNKMLCALEILAHLAHHSTASFVNFKEIMKSPMYGSTMASILWSTMHLELPQTSYFSLMAEYAIYRVNYCQITLL